MDELTQIQRIDNLEMVLGRDLGVEICKALEIDPAHVKKLTITVEPVGAALIRVEYWAWKRDINEVKKVFESEEFVLMRKKDVDDA